MSAEHAASSSAEPPPDAAPHDDQTHRTLAIRTWSLVFRPVAVSELEGFDLVVISGVRGSKDNWLSPAQLATLQAQSVLVVAHVPMVGTPARISQLHRAVIRWPHRTDVAWDREGALDRVREAARAGWDGVYLDDVDEVVALPAGADRVTSFINVCRAAMPGGVVILQSVADDVVRLADAVGPEMSLRGAAGQQNWSARGKSAPSIPMATPVDLAGQLADGDTVPRARTLRARARTLRTRG